MYRGLRVERGYDSLTTDMQTKSDTITGWRAALYNRLMGIFGARRVYEKALELIARGKGERFLDVGCGTGTFLRMASERFPNARLTGVDASEDMLTQARKALQGLPVELIYADAAILPFPNESFAFVVSVLTFHHLPQSIKIRAIQEIARVLKKGGKCLIVDFGRAETAWGSLNLFFLNWHSHTRGNMTLVEQELARWGLRQERQKWHRGFVEFLLARMRT